MNSKNGVRIKELESELAQVRQAVGVRCRSLPPNHDVRRMLVQAAKNPAAPASQQDGGEAHRLLATRAMWTLLRFGYKCWDQDNLPDDADYDDIYDAYQYSTKVRDEAQSKQDGGEG